MRCPLSVASLFRALALAAALAGPAAAPLPAQSLFATRGLGLPVSPQDARSHALGGVSLGLPDYELSWANPAGAVGLPAAGLLVSLQLDDFEGRLGERSATGNTARFPLLLGAFPFGEKWVLTAGFGGFLDQNWAVQQRDTLTFGTDSISVLDRFTSEGGVSRFRLGGGYRLLPGLSVGAGVDLYTGGVRRVSGRVFTQEEVEPRCCRAEWRYSGLGYVASVDWSPTEALSLALSGSAGGTLDAEVRAGDAAAARYDVPLLLHAGASARVAASLLVAVAAEWAGWSSLDAALAEQGGARDGRSFQGGLEWDALRLADRPVPLRVGARTRDLPFRWSGAGSEFAAERALTGGTGIVLGGGAARMDLSVERGQRGGEAAGLDESFWRLLFSVTVLGR